MKQPKFRPWHPVKVHADNDKSLSLQTSDWLNKADCIALQQVAQGVGSEEQQKRAMRAVMHICGVDDLEFLPDEHGGERETSFKSGKRFVGTQIRKLITTNILILTGEKNDR